jgi:uncharacterized protein (DUF305 family)
MTAAQSREMPEATPEPARRVNPLLVLLMLLVLVALVLVVWLTTRQTVTPGENSAETGFARDMILHHEQAVNMALMLYDRTDNPTLRAIALDMMLGQQNQIGQMQGWLSLWGLPVGSAVPPMTWMGMPVEGLMPGMATDDQLAALSESTGIEADRLFIQLMIPHHQSGVHMASAILEDTSIPAVRDLANSIIATQQREITELQRIADSLDAESDAPPVTPEATPQDE